MVVPRFICAAFIRSNGVLPTDAISITGYLRSYLDEVSSGWVFVLYPLSQICHENVALMLSYSSSNSVHEGAHHWTNGAQNFILSCRYIVYFQF